MSRIQILLKIIVVISLGFILYRAVFISVEDHSQLRNFKYGDSISDKMTLSATRYFFDHGFLATYFRPVHLYPNNQPMIYTHYGAFPDVLSGAFATLIGSTAESILRILPILFSLLTMILFYQLLILYSVDKNDSLLIVGIVLLSNWFLMWADALNKHVYEFFILILSLRLSYFVMKNRRLNLGMAFALFIGFLSIHVSYELVAYLAVFNFFLIVFNRQYSKFYILLLVALYLGFIFGFMSHLYLNYLVLNDYQTTIQDLVRAMHVRGSMSLLNRVKAVILYFQRINIYFYFDWTLLFFSFYFFQKQLKDIRLKNIFYSLCLASFAWPLFMPQHVLVHEFTTRWLFLLVIFCTHYFIFPWIKNWKSHFKQLGQWEKVTLIGYAGYLLVLIVYHQWWMTFVRNLKVIFNA